ncbi:MAG TPA: M3 family metallopeptidase [Burkholderiales bacterium]|nr:M3 family metallopeptidase [Burkholderiales bacterium]
MNNPLLDFSGLPRFDTLSAAHIAPAIDTLLAENRSLLAELVRPQVPPTWKDFIAPMEDAHERLSRAWGVVGHLHGVLDSPELRDAYNETQPKVVAYYTEVGQNLALFEKYKTLRASSEFDRLSTAQKKIIENEIRDFRLSGAELSDDKKKRYADISAELARLQTKFSENVLDATNAFALCVEDAERLRGIPEDVLQAAKADAEKDNKPGWKLTLRAPCYVPVLQYAENRILRETLYKAYATRASEFGENKWDNGPLITELLRLRREQAQLLGYSNFAEVSLVPKMAESPRQVLDFLNDLAIKARPFARKDYEELERFASTELDITELQSWDLAYASEKLRVQRYAFSDQEVKQYFPEPKVLEGMFKVVSAIYGLRMEEDEAATWDRSVRFFRIVDATDTIIGRFYLDLYARETKRGGAWMDEAITRRSKTDGVQTPVAYLVCNFSAPVGDKPALFTHEEVLTLFHEFGHGLHHLLTQVDELGVSGIHGVEWDAVELPSQFMENFAWEWDVLKHMTAHVETGEALPKSLYEKMVAAKNFQSGMQTVRQLEFSLFDMHLHYDFDSEAGKSPLALLDEIRQRVAVAFPPEYSRFPHSFSHIFAGGYSAGYYSYKWAEVLSADAYSLFEENGVLDPKTGARFRDEILAVGGSRPALESFKAFRGREPAVDALLRHNGMIATA